MQYMLLLVFMNLNMEPILKWHMYLCLWISYHFEILHCSNFEMTHLWLWISAILKWHICVCEFHISIACSIIIGSILKWFTEYPSDLHIVISFHYLNWPIWPLDIHEVLHVTDRKHYTVKGNFQALHQINGKPQSEGIMSLSWPTQMEWMCEIY